MLPLLWISLITVLRYSASQHIFSGLDSDEQCSHLLVRQEWRTLSVERRQEYIRAVKCTHELLPLTSLEGVLSRFDDFHAAHIATAEEVHHVGHFLPWHRFFVSLYEATLRQECGFHGAIPYWDWSKDVDGGLSLRQSPVFDPVNGFGGDGVPGTYALPEGWEVDESIHPATFGGCVQDGPFASVLIHLGPGIFTTHHCLVRKIQDFFGSFLTFEAVNRAMIQPTYEKFRVALEGGKDHAEHDAGHLIIGGDFGNLYSSPADPLFFLHHANLDRIWWNWQFKNLTARLDDMTGWAHNDASNATIALDYPLKYTTLAPGVLIRDVMDIREYPLCYIYE